MKRIMKITILSLFICAGTLTDAQIVEQVASLKEQMDRMCVTDWREKDGNKCYLLNQLSYEAKEQIIRAFMSEFKTALESGDAAKVLDILRSHDAPCLLDIENFIKFDENLVDKLRQICASYRFQMLFRNLTRDGLFNRNHILSVCRFICFAITGKTMKKFLTTFEHLGDTPHSEFIAEMSSDIRNLFAPERNLDQLFGDLDQAKRRLYEIEKGIPSSESPSCFGHFGNKRRPKIIITMSCFLFNQP